MIAEDSRIAPRSDLVIIREELAAVVAENLRLRGGTDGKDAEAAAMSAGSRRQKAGRKGLARSATGGSR